MKTKPRPQQRNTSWPDSGIGVDYYGERAFDPSRNVADLNHAAKERQDDLREYSERLMTSEIGRLDAHVDHLKELGIIRAAHATEIRQMETERLDSIRQVDVLARNTAADRAADAIQALAATTATNAENLRTALANTAATIAKQTEDARQSTAKVVSDQFEALTRRTATLEATAYRGEGREKFADPQMDKLMAVVNDLALAAKQGTGKSEGYNAAWVIVVGAIMMVLSIAGTAIAFAVMSRSSNPAPASQVIYSQPPAPAR